MDIYFHELCNMLTVRKIYFMKSACTYGHGRLKSIIANFFPTKLAYVTICKNMFRKKDPGFVEF